MFQEQNLLFFILCGVISVFLLITILYMIKRRKTKAKVQPPQTFVEGMNIEQWLDQFDRYMQCKQIKSPTSQTNYLKLHMDNAAWQLVENTSSKINKNNHLDYLLIRPLLCKMFSLKRINQRERIVEFLNMTQKQDESLQLYYARLISAGPTVFPGYAGIQLDDLIYTQFVFGINNKEIRERLFVDYGSTSIIDALDIAERLTTLTKIDNRPTNGTGNNTATNPTTTTNINIGNNHPPSTSQNRTINNAQQSKN